MKTPFLFYVFRAYAVEDGFPFETRGLGAPLSGV